MAALPKTKNLIHLVEPGGGAPSATSVHIVEPDDDDDEPSGGIGGGISSEMGNGDLQIAFGKPKASKRGADKNFERNLAEDIDDHDLDAICGNLLQSIEADELDRRDWEETANLTSAYLGVKLEDPVTSVSADGTVCRAVATCMLEAAMKMWGVARAELLPVSGPVKVRKDTPPEPSDSEQQQAGIAAGGDQEQPPPSGIAAGPPPQGQPPPPQPTPSGDGDDLARALEMDMNHYLTVVDKPYYPDTSKMLMHRTLIGMAFKKVYRDPLLRRPVSRWVKAQNLIVKAGTTHLGEGGARYTERIPTSQSDMRRLMVMGHYRDIPLSHPTARPSNTELAIENTEGVAAVSQLPGDYQHVVYECYTELGSGTGFSLIGDIADLDHDEKGKKPGYPLPYRITIDVDSRKILEIRRNWKKGDSDHRPRCRYVKFGMVPGFGFYDWGLIHLTGNPTQAATMIQRAMTDSAIFANFPGGVYLKGPGGRQANTVIRPNPGEFVGMDAAGAQKIQDVLMPLPYKPPTPEIMALVQKYESDVNRLSGVMEIPVGEGRLGNTPVGTIMSYIESISQVPGAVHKDDHIAQQEEFAKLRELFADEPEALVRGVKRPARQWQIADEILEPELVPAADPNTPSEVHRLLKVQGIVTLGGLPQFQGILDQKAIAKFAVEALTGERGEEFIMPPQAAPPPAPDPKIVAAQIKAQSDQQKVQAQQQSDQMKHDERMQELASEDTQRDADRQSAETRAAMALEGNKVKAMHGSVDAHLDRQHEAGLQQGQQQHEAGQQAAQQQHDAGMQQGQQQHDAMQAGADRQQADMHKQADQQQQLAMGGMTSVENQADREHESDQATQAQKATAAAAKKKTTDQE